MTNYLVHFRVTKYGIKAQQYHTLVATSFVEARYHAQQLADMLPGTVVVISVRAID